MNRKKVEGRYRSINPIDVTKTIHLQNEFLFISFDSPIFFFLFSFYRNGKTFRDHIYFRSYKLYRSIVITISWYNFPLPRHPRSLHYTYTRTYIQHIRTYLHTHTHIPCPSNSELTVKTLAVCMQAIARTRFERKLRRTWPRRNWYRLRNAKSNNIRGIERRGGNPFAARNIL